jgi:hypothetical protein
MKSFKTFISESTLTTNSSLEEVESVLNAAVGDGVITKMDWDTAKYILSHMMSDDWDAARKPLSNYIYKENHKDNPKTWSFDEYAKYQKTPMYKLESKVWVNVSQTDGVKKLIDDARKGGVKKFGEKFYVDSLITPMEEFWVKYSSICKTHTDLKSKIVTVRQIQSKKRAEKENTFSVMRTNSQAMIDALMSRMEEAKKMAKESAERKVDDTWKKLEKKNWDIIDDIKFSKKFTDHVVSFYKSLTDEDPKSREKNQASGESFRFDSRFRKKSPSKKKAYVDNAVNQVEEDYKSFIGKMVMKVGGGIVGANVTGHPWTNSVLTVDMADGTKQVWNTKMIINYSVYGKAFNQFPSRRKK